MKNYKNRTATQSITVSVDSRRRVRTQHRVVGDWRSMMWTWSSMPMMKQVVRDARGLAHQPGAAGPAASHTLVKFKKTKINLI